MTPADLLAIRKAGLERKLMGTTYQVKCLACNETHDFGKVDVRDLQDARELAFGPVTWLQTHGLHKLRIQNNYNEEQKP